MPRAVTHRRGHSNVLHIKLTGTVRLMIFYIYKAKLIVLSKLFHMTL